jgi:uncharacterized membrane protein YkoI
MKALHRIHLSKRIAALAIVVVALSGSDLLADDHRHDQDAARQAVERGEIKPLADILAAIRSRIPGDVVGVQIEQKRSRWVYELRVADTKGRLFEVYVDAQTANIERIKEK